MTLLLSLFLSVSPRAQTRGGTRYTHSMLPALLVIAQNGFQDHELGPTRNALLNAGFSVVLASTQIGACVGKYGSTEEATIVLKDVRVSAYDRIAFIGGPGAFALVENEDALRIARETASSALILGAICIAPKILAAAGVLAGKKATVAESDGTPKVFLVEKGAVYTGEAVTVDGGIITANGPDAAEEFGQIFATMDF